jgi:hypothetical protein
MPERPKLDPSLRWTESPAPTPCMNGTALKKYDPTLNALTEAERVGEVKDIRDKAVAMEEYARRAKNTELIERAVDTRFRAERRAGEILVEMKARGERDDGKGNRNPTLKSQAATPKLADLGITKSESSKWQQLAALELDEFETQVEQGKKRALAAIDRTAKPARAKARAPDSAAANLRGICRAVETLCTGLPVDEVAAVAGGLKGVAAADVARAIEFLQKLQRALCPTDSEA